VSKSASSPGVDDDDDTVQAAGGVVWRRHDGEVQVLLVHRPKYDDWTLPKGKLEPGETHVTAAVREVREETGLRCDLGTELVESRYHDAKGRPKVVRYWMMTVRGGSFDENDEVDEVRWLTVGRAAKSLTYKRDLPVLESFERELARLIST
jgi:8-oxo-dGTP pyrophosphatase MutT (NUDIX family)